MRRAKLESPHPDAVRKMVAAVVALSEDPGATNVERYLAASRALEDSRPQRVRRRRSKRETPAYGADLAA